MFGGSRLKNPRDVWKKLSRDWFKLNFDRDVEGNPRLIGGGGIFSDDDC